jgi:hypothetical protein
MIRRILTTIAVGTAAAAAPAAAQSGFGIVGGLVSSNESINPASPVLTTSSRTGFAGGVSYAATVSANLVFAPEVMYVMKGLNLSGTGPSITIKVKERIGYLEVPMLLRYMFGLKGASLLVTAGPAIAFKTSCTEDQTGISGEPASQDCNDSAGANPGIKSSDIGVMFGAGVAVHRFAFSVRYDAGLKNISQDTSAGASTAKNKAILALVSITLGK